MQLDHFDWGFRFSTLYGENYRYTTAYGLMSYQLSTTISSTAIDFPMVYTDLYFPVFQGTNVRVGRFISIPDIEAQLAPNNYTYVHSLTYTFDNYTNTGVQVTSALTKNWIIQTALPSAATRCRGISVRPLSILAAGQSALSRHNDCQRSRGGALRHFGLPLDER